MFRCTIPLLGTIILSAVVGCSAGGETSISGAGGDGGSPSTTSSSGSTGSGMSSSSGSSSGSAGGGGGGTSIPFCKQGCTTANDCIVNGGSAAYDVDNYACNQGVCDYTGCNSDAECAATFPNLGYVCGTKVPGYPASCVKGCIVASDCTIAGAGPAFDADNYACSSGKCEYKGCNTDAECQFSGPKYGCKIGVPGGAPGCYLTCITAGDCPPSNAGPAFDIDNYSCSQGYCEYTGCNSDSECAASIPTEGYVCR